MLKQFVIIYLKTLAYTYEMILFARSFVVLIGLPLQAFLNFKARYPL